MEDNKLEQQQLLILIFSSFIIGFGVWIFLLKNFTIEWLKVRMSGGRKILIKVISPIGDYFVAGEYHKSHLQFRARKRRDNKEPNRLIYVESIKDAIYSSFGVKCIDVDDYKDSVYYRYNDSYKSVCGANTEYTDELVKTALAKPSEEGIGFFNAKTWQAIILISIVILGILAFMVYKNTKTSMERQVLLHDEHVMIANELNETKTLIKQISLFNPSDTGIYTGGK